MLYAKKSNLNTEYSCCRSKIPYGSSIGLTCKIFPRPCVLVCLRLGIRDDRKGRSWILIPELSTRRDVCVFYINLMTVIIIVLLSTNKHSKIVIISHSCCLSNCFVVSQFPIDHYSRIISLSSSLNTLSSCSDFDVLWIVEYVHYILRTFDFFYYNWISVTWISEYHLSIYCFTIM